VSIRLELPLPKPPTFSTLQPGMGAFGKQGGPASIETRATRLIPSVRRRDICD
jgi:hypothetical protein